MKYQKSMMKLMEKILLYRDEGRSIERAIEEAQTGRNSSFRALKWLENNGFIKIQPSGNQKIVKPVVDNYTLQYKYYLDSMRFKTLDPFIKLVATLFVSELFSNEKIKMVVLFGSVLKKENYNDIDLLLLGAGLNANNIKSFSKIKEKIERIFDIIINIHLGEPDLNNLFKGIVIYQSSYIKFRDKLQKQYMEFLEWTLEAIKNQNDKKIFENAFDNAVLNLSYVYCYLNQYYPETKTDALEFFKEKYKISNLKELKKRGIEIGKKIFY